MAKYSLVFKKSVAKDLRNSNIPKKDIKRILNCVELLCSDPRAAGCIKLSGQERYRVRQGLYRIIYEIQETELIIMVVKVAHRSVVYKSG
ncbi:MAG: type II toxin-antitoxin system RelE/ParE family toxin [Gammaproteobacteria bacterium]|nr:type II toxin-antitoxin system RelE/ParE family toxin [Gammaproteobacteria bacterium]